MANYAPTPALSRGHYCLKPSQVAELLKLPVRQVYRLIESGALVATDTRKPGARDPRYIISTFEVERFLTHGSAVAQNRAPSVIEYEATDF